MQQLIEYASYVPHGYCLFWQPWLVILYAGSDLMIFIAYSAIPFALLNFLRRRPDFGYRGLLALFAAFILLCGITHLISLVTLWIPIYPLHGVVKLATGVVSGVTAVVLFKLIPQLVAIPSRRQLEEANSRLTAEISAHEATLAQLGEAQRDLEFKVRQRTRELTEANEKLAVVTRETVHRSRNLLTIVSSMARQTARGTREINIFLNAFLGRLDALATATASVMRDPSQTSTSLQTLVQEQLAPVLLTYADRIVIEGPPIDVSAEAAQQLSLVVHELATNAQKFGALATNAGDIRLTWEIKGKGCEGKLALRWQEVGLVAEGHAGGQTTSGGFGTKLLLEAVPAMLRGSACRTPSADGICYELVVPLHSLRPTDPERGEQAVLSQKASFAFAEPAVT